ncbi:MAG: hypothetical protein WC813_02515 [Patescibacteria group bacterium]|jgi:hypothetical protein
MSTFENPDQLRIAIRGILKEAPDINTAKRWIRALSGPPLGQLPEGAPASHGLQFDIPGEIIVRFNEDGSRDASCTIATQHDDPDPQYLSVHWAPEQEKV